MLKFNLYLTNKCLHFQVNMWSENKYGKSLPSYTVKVVTHLQGEEAAPAPGQQQDTTQAIPDVRSCCVANNVSHVT